MTDAELIERLRAGATWDDDVAAADRIEQLERELSISRMAQVVMDNSFEALTAEALYAAFLVEDDFGNYINKDPDTSSVTLDGCFSFDVIIAVLKGESRD